jgi:hypothetical protein
MTIGSGNLAADCGSLAVGDVERDGSEYRRREVRTSEPSEVQRVKSLLATAERMKNTSQSFHHHIGGGRLFVKMYREQSDMRPSDVLEIRDGLVYEDGQLVARMDEEAVDALRQLLANETPRVIRP